MNAPFCALKSNAACGGDGVCIAGRLVAVALIVVGRYLVIDAGQKSMSLWQEPQAAAEGTVFQLSTSSPEPWWHFVQFSMIAGYSTFPPRMFAVFVAP